MLVLGIDSSGIGRHDGDDTLRCRFLSGISESESAGPLEDARVGSGRGVGRGVGALVSGVRSAPVSAVVVRVAGVASVRTVRRVAVITIGIESGMVGRIVVVGVVTLLVGRSVHDGQDGGQQNGDLQTHVEFDNQVFVRC